MVREIVNKSDDILTKKCRLVEKFDQKLWSLLDDMADTMYEANGVGLAANQIGIMRQVAVIDIGEELIELINPEVIAQSGEQEGAEGCLSCPGEYGLVVRPECVTVKAFDRNGDEFEIIGEGYLARALCHETDHLKGEIFLDKVIRMLGPEDLMTKEEG